MVTSGRRASQNLGIMPGKLGKMTSVAVPMPNVVQVEVSLMTSVSCT